MVESCWFGAESNGKVALYQRTFPIAHMIRKSTNKDGVKLLAAIAVVAIAFVGLAVLPASSIEGDVKEVNADYRISNVSELLAFAEDVNTNGGQKYNGKVVVLTNDIDLSGVVWEPIGQTNGYSKAGSGFMGTFDGQNHVIKNMNVTLEKWNDNGETGDYASGFFGFVDVTGTTIKNVKFENAEVSGHHYVGVVAGYMTGTIQNCHVYGSTLKNTHLDNEACGDKTGVITGCVNGGTGTESSKIIRCSATNCEVYGSRDAGQLCGMIYKDVTVSECSVKNVKVKQNSVGECHNEEGDDITGSNIKDEIVGRDLGGTIEDENKYNFVDHSVITEDTEGEYVLFSMSSSIEIKDGRTFNGSVIFGENKITFTNLKAGVGGLTIIPGSLTIQGVIDASSEVEITASGDIKIDDVTVSGSNAQNGGLVIKSDGCANTSVTVVGDLVVCDGATLVIEAGARITVPKTSSIEVSSSAKIVVNEATNLVVEGKVTVYGTLSGDVENLPDGVITEDSTIVDDGTNPDPVMHGAVFHEIGDKVKGESEDSKPYTVTKDMTIEIADRQSGEKKIILADGVTVTLVGKKDTNLSLSFWVGVETDVGINYCLADNNLYISKPTDGSITITANYKTEGSTFILNGDVDVHHINARNSQDVSVKKDSSLVVSGIIDEVKEISYGVKIKEVMAGSPAEYTLYSVGTVAPKVELSAPGDKVVVKNGSIEVQQGSSIVKMEDVVSEKGIIVSYGEGMPTIGGIATSGILTIKTGVFAKSGDELSGIGCTFNYVQNTVSGDIYYTSEVVERIKDNVITSAVVFGTVEQKKNLDTKVELRITLGGANGSKYIIPEGRTLGQKVVVNSTGGNIIVYGTVMGKVGGAGYVFISPTGFIADLVEKTPVLNFIDGIYSDSKVSGSLKGVETDDKILGYNDLREDGSSTIPAGETYTIEGLFGLNGQILRVEGTLVIAGGAEFFDVGCGSIIIGEKGRIVIDGTFAKMMPIGINTDDSNCIMISGIEGIQIFKVGGALAVSGNISPIAGSVRSEIYLEGNAVISGNLKVAENVTLETSNVVVEDKSVLIVDGTFYGQISAEKNAKIEMNGIMGDESVITVKTGEAGIMSVTAGGSLTGFTIDVTSEAKKEKIIYTPYISGDIESVGAEESGMASTVAISGDFTVAEHSILNIDSDVEPNFISSTITIGGLVSVVGNDGIGTYEGAMYTKTEKVGTDNITTFYYTTLKVALEQVESADKMTVFINMGEIDTSFALEEKQILKSDEDLKITSESVVIVKDGAKIDAQIASVSGKLVVGKEASVSTPASYDAEYMDGTSTVYAGLAVAIKESDGSTPIEVIDSSVDGDLVIDGTKVLEVAGLLDVKGDLIVEGGAALIGGTIIVAGGEDGSQVEIYGTLDVTDGVFSADNAEVTVYGTLVSSSAIVGINAAMYSADSKLYYTDIATAVGSGKDVTIYGEYAESETVTIAAGKKIIIDASADVEIPKIVLSAGSSVEADGALKAIISTNSASVEIDGKIAMADVKAKERNAAYASVTAIDGKFNVLDGTVFIEAEVAFDQSEIAIDSDAAVVVAEDAKLTVNSEGAFVIDGKLTVDGAFVAKDVSVVGDLEINNDSEVEYLEVNGNVVIADKKKLTVANDVVVGSYNGTGANGMVVGKIVLSNDKKTVRAYAGSDLSKAVLTDLKKTAYFVNGVEFATVYAKEGKVKIDEAIVAEDLTQIPGVDVPTKITWVKENGTAVGDAYVGGIEVVKTTLTSKTVAANVYVQNGIELHLGYGYYYTEGEANLALGPNDAYGTSADGKSVVVKVFVNGVEVPVVDNKVDITVDMIGQQVVVQASYGTPAPAPVQPTADVDVYIKAAGDNKVSVRIIANDGGYIENGKVYVTISYTEYDEFFGDYRTETEVLEFEVVSENDGDVLLTVDIPAELTTAYAASASFTSGTVSDNAGAIFL